MASCLVLEASRVRQLLAQVARIDELSIEPLCTSESVHGLWLDPLGHIELPRPSALQLAAAGPGQQAPAAQPQSRGLACSFAYHEQLPVRMMLVTFGNAGSKVGFGGLATNQCRLCFHLRGHRHN